MAVLDGLVRNSEYSVRFVLVSSSVVMDGQCPANDALDIELFDPWSFEHLDIEIY